MSLEQVALEQEALLKQQNATIEELTAALNSSTRRLQRAMFECLEQQQARVAAEAELSSRRFAHWAVHAWSALFIGYLLVQLVRNCR